MIKFSNQVPSVYTSASRDFQYLGWLINVVLNSVKHNVDDLYNLPNNQADVKLTELLALTLGFKVKRNYDQKQLSAIVAALPRIIKYKGTKTAIDMAGNALLAASGVLGEFKSQHVGGELIVTFPVGLIDISLFTDLLEYILPAGMTCHIVRETEWHSPYATALDYQEKLIADWIPDLTIDDNSAEVTGLSSMYPLPVASTITKDNFDDNFIVTVDENDKQQVIPNFGLLSNSIIPVLAGPIVNKTMPTVPDYTEEQNEYGTTVIIEHHTDEENEFGTTTIIGGQ